VSFCGVLGVPSSTERVLEGDFGYTQPNTRIPVLKYIIHRQLMMCTHTVINSTAHTHAYIRQADTVLIQSPQLFKVTTLDLFNVYYSLGPRSDRIHTHKHTHTHAHDWLLRTKRAGKDYFVGRTVK